MNQAGAQKIIVVTGASRGIGRACAEVLAAPGVALALVSRKAQDLEEAREACEKRGASAHGFACDLSDMAAIDALVDRVRQHFGGPIHALVNNAGIWIEKPFEQGDMEAWEQALDVNLKAPIRLTRNALEGMPDGGGVVFIGSSASRRAYAGGSNYCAAKHGLLAFAQALFEDARERGIKVCSVLPGVVDTDMHAQDPAMEKSKMIKPEDVASAVAFALNSPPNVCPVEIALQPQRLPKRRA